MEDKELFIYDHECPFCEEALAHVEQTQQWFCNNEQCEDYWGNVYWLEEPSSEEG